jgi:hypothetical protein
MLIEFRVSNFRSFNEEQVFSLVASNDPKHPDNLIPCDTFSLLRGAAIYGPNASGKSNLIKAIGLVGAFIRHSATRMNQGDKISWIVPFRLSAKSQRQPSSFEATVLVDGTRFEYGFTATPERIHEEWLAICPPNGRRQRLMERKFNLDRNQTTWIFRGARKAEERILRERTRDNGLALSRAAELNIRPMSDLFLWFRENLRILDLSDRPVALLDKTAERIKGNSLLLKRVTQLIRHADLGVDSIAVAEVPILLKDLPEELRSMFSARIERAASGNKRILKDGLVGLSVRVFHCLGTSGNRVGFDLQADESNGTQRFFALAGPFLEALDTGAVVVVDELDCSMHPLLTRKLIELFQSPKANKKGAQLIFATHDSTLMDPELFRRDQIWLVEKNSRGASELFSLYDFETKDRPRNTEAFERNYLAGRYGGVPKFGPIFENLEIK